MDVARVHRAASLRHHRAAGVAKPDRLATGPRNLDKKQYVTIRAAIPANIRSSI